MKDSKPKYQVVVDWVKQQIDTGKLKPGKKIPSENTLTDQFGLSRQTIRHAISVLEKEEIVYSLRGSGTYVKEQASEIDENRKTIVIMMTYVDGYIFPRTIKGIEDKLFGQGYSVQIAFTNNRIDRERIILEDILRKNDVAGIIAECTKSGLPNPDIGLYKEIMKRKIPLLFMNSFYDQLDAPHISIMDQKAGYLATKTLLEKGHTKIAGMFKLDDGQGRLRYAGFVDAVNEKGIPWHDDSIIWYETWDTKQLWRMKAKILERIKGCTGIVTYNDEIAFELLKFLGEEGIRVPEDLSIVSIDDSELAVLADVKITSIPYPMEKLGEKAAENMLHMIHDRKFDGNYEFDVWVNERDSVKDLNI